MSIIHRIMTGVAIVVAVFVAMPGMALAPPGPTITYVDDDGCPGGDGSQRARYCSNQQGGVKAKECG